MRKSTTIRRLNKLADFLDTVPRKRFDYKRWVGEDWNGKQDLSCGTTGCALGWAATMPTFRKLGLKLDYFEHVFEGPIGVPSFDGVDQFHAAVKLFGIEFDDAEHLFMPALDGSEDDATPKYVARKIRRFVERLEREG